MKRRFYGICAAAIAFSVVACDNTATTTNTNDSSSTTNSTTSTPTTTSSEGSYAALADSVERNSQQGYYINPRTGKAYSKLSVDRTTGRVTDEAGEPVWRYVDNRNWWVYGGDNWGQVGEAKMDGSKLMYKGDGDKWVDYDTRWKTDDEAYKVKYGDTKIKVEKDGDIKIKEGDKKTKIDEDGVKKDSTR